MFIIIVIPEHPIKQIQKLIDFYYKIDDIDLKVFGF